MQAGAAMEKIQEIARFSESARFTERERVALEVAERMTITGQRVDDELFARARRHFSEPEFVELAATVALENFRSKLNVALGIEAQGFCVLPGALA
jgi:alkylhydroperoxidase family enzyme